MSLWTVPPVATPRTYLSLMRLRHAHKSVLVVAAPLLDAKLLTDPVTLLLAVTAFVFLGSTVYVYNDLHDRERDAAHPTKRLRPIAAGHITVTEARVLVLTCSSVAVVLSALLGPWTLLTATAYLLLHYFYSSQLKHVPFLEILIVASGYPLRVLFGAYAMGAEHSTALYISVFCAAVGLVSGKRIAEKELQVEARPVLDNYDKHTLSMLRMCSWLLVPLVVSVWSLAQISLGGYVVAALAWIFVLIMVRTPVSEQPELVLLQRPILALPVLLAVIIVIFMQVRG
jgi:decaprenyl-phosphate phosphoribosyltransferase